jgi:hypothetical protein
VALTTYSGLKTAVANWLNRTDLTSYIPDFIALAEERIYRDLRIKAMETAFSSTVASGVIALPTDYLELKSAYVDGSPIYFLERASLEDIYSKYPTRAAGGKPLYIAREGENFIFGPYPDAAYTIKGIYYKKLPALSDSNTTNWLTSSAPSLILFGALTEAAPFLKDDARLAIWEGKFQTQMRDVQRADKREALRGSSLTMSAGSTP